MKSQDVLLLCLLIANKESRSYKQSELASLLCMSSSTINKSLKKLEDVGLISSYVKEFYYYPDKIVCEEFFIKGLYAFLPKDKFHPKIDIILKKNNNNFKDFWYLIECAWLSPSWKFATSI